MDLDKTIIMMVASSCSSDSNVGVGKKSYEPTKEQQQRQQQTQLEQKQQRQREMKQKLQKLRQQEKWEQFLEEEQLQAKGPPLAGAGKDVIKLKKKYGRQPHFDVNTIQSSLHESTLVPKKNIMEWIQKYFKQANKIAFLFYTGHGHRNGDWAIETIENKQGDRISLKQIVDLWNLSKKNQQSLYILMDSCFSGNWCYRLHEMKAKGITIIASSADDQESVDMKSGGLFYRCIFEKDETKNENNFKMLQKNQHPIFSYQGGQPCFITKELLAKLQKDLRNVIQFAKTKTEIHRQQRRIKPGIVLQAKCQNPACRSFNKFVRINKGFDKSNISKAFSNLFCPNPKCGQKTKKDRRIAVYKAKIQIEGGIQNKDEDIQIVSKSIEAIDDQLHEFQEFYKYKWEYLQVKKLEDIQLIEN